VTVVDSTGGVLPGATVTIGQSCAPRAELRRVRLVRNVPAKAPVETDASSCDRF